jgi:hypothetical protein
LRVGIVLLSESGQANNTSGQNTVLKLSYAHVRIVINRQFLLANFANLGHHNNSDDNIAAQHHIDKCINATCMILDTGSSFILCYLNIRWFL